MNDSISGRRHNAISGLVVVAALSLGLIVGVASAAARAVKPARRAPGGANVHHRVHRHRYGSGTVTSTSWGASTASRSISTRSPTPRNEGQHLQLRWSRAVDLGARPHRQIRRRGPRLPDPRRLCCRLHPGGDPDAVARGERFRRHVLRRARRALRQPHRQCVVQSQQHDLQARRQQRPQHAARWLSGLEHQGLEREHVDRPRRSQPDADSQLPGG